MTRMTEKDLMRVQAYRQILAMAYLLYIRSIVALLAVRMTPHPVRPPLNLLTVGGLQDKNRDGKDDRIIATIRKEAPIEPVGVIVLGIDGLRQDVLYTSGEASYSDPQGCGGQSCYVPLMNDTLPGLLQILKPASTVKLKDVTAIFPSITFASWASIFTGKMPKDTGILGNEFFARDLYDPATPNNWIIPGMDTLPSGMVTLDADGGAFRPVEPMRGPYSLLPKSLLFALSYIMPLDWPEQPGNNLETKINSSAPGTATQAQPFWSDINALVSSRYSVSADPNVRCDSTAKECRTVSMFNQYAKGADWWGTPSVKRSGALLKKITLDMGLYSSAVMDSMSADEAEGFIKDYFAHSSASGNRKKFPAVFSVYLPGIDHYAHADGMAGYKNYFMTVTDAKIAQIIKTLKAQDEFYNKIFLITADHGHTAMPTDLTYKDKNWLGLTVEKPAEMSCELKTDFGNVDSPNKSARNAELNNNNLHIWELGEMLNGLPTGELTVDGKAIYHKILAPTEIVAANKGKTTTNDPKQASIIAALNGPMAHIYVKGPIDWSGDPQNTLLIKVADLLQASLAEGDGPISRLASSVNAILIRLTRNSDYVVYNGATLDTSGQITFKTPIPITTYFSNSSKYIDAINRIKGMNHPYRSGDIVLVMKDATTGAATDRYTTAYGCKSWHGSLNPSDSYVPFIISYPGGNKLSLEPIIQKVCTNSMCEGNWKAKDVISEIIKTQYSGQ